VPGDEALGADAEGAVGVIEVVVAGENEGGGLPVALIPIRFDMLS